MSITTKHNITLVEQVDQMINIRIKPRQHILDIFEAFTKTAIQNGSIQFLPKEDTDSLQDAELMLCILYPATQLQNTGFALARAGKVHKDVLKSLAAWGDQSQIQKDILRAVDYYLRRYTTEDNRPVFTGTSRLRTYSEGNDGTKEGITEEQRNIDITDAFSTSIHWCLAVLEFLREIESQDGKTEQIDKLRKDTSHRLSAAMVGLLRSFTITVFEKDSEPEKCALDMLNRASSKSSSEVNKDIRKKLYDLRVEIVEAMGRNFNDGDGYEALMNADKPLFEVGWSWGVLSDHSVLPSKVVRRRNSAKGIR